MTHTQPIIEINSSADPKEVALAILSGRGVTGEHIQDILSPKLADLQGRLSEITNFDRAAEIICDNIHAQAKTVIFGDYDADGICSNTLIGALLRCFRVKNIHQVVPDRLVDGHGLSKSALPLITTHKPDLLVVVDCGTTSSAMLEVLAKEIKYIIILDHHGAESRPSLPDNVILVNPAIEENDEYRQRWGICCAGSLCYLFALHVGRYWRANREKFGEIPTDEEIKENLIFALALATVTIITDMVPLRGINRAILNLGLQYVSMLPAIRALASNMKYPLDPDKITPEDIGFKYGPAINAAGRIANGAVAMKLMASGLITNPDEINEIAQEALEINTARRGIQDDVLDNCIADIENSISGATNHGIMVRNPQFHQGVVGLAASRIMEATRRPAIVIGANYTGSGRSFDGFNIGDFIREQVELGRLTHGGGHAGAGGFTLNTELPENEQLFKKDFEEATKNLLRPHQRIDVLLKPSANIDLFALYKELYPYGMGNQALRIKIESPEFYSQKWFGNNGRHWEGRVKSNGSSIRACVFNASDSRIPAFKKISEHETLFAPGQVKSMTVTLLCEYDNYHKKYVMTFRIEDLQLND